MKGLKLKIWDVPLIAGLIYSTLSPPKMDPPLAETLDLQPLLQPPRDRTKNNGDGCQANGEIHKRFFAR